MKQTGLAAPESGSMFAPLRQPVYRALWLATLASNFGTYIQMVATSWAMTEMTGRADMVALVQTVANLPIMLFSLVAGALADMYDRRLMMIVAQSLMLTVSVILAVMAFSGTIAPGTLLVFTFLLGCGNALYNPPWAASIGDQVSRELVPRAVALNVLSNNGARSTGPALGGIIVALAGTSAAFLVNALSYIGLIVVLIRWRPTRTRRADPSRSLLHNIREGAAYVRNRRDVRNLLVGGASFTFGTGGIWALMPLVAHDRLAGNAATYGLLFGAFGTGAIAGALLSNMLRQRLGIDRLIRLFICGFAFASVVTGLVPLLLPALLAHVIAGASWVLVLSSFNICLQLSLPRPVLGRVLAIYQTTTFGGLALGTLFWGWLAMHWTLPAALVSAACLLLAGGAHGLRTALPRPEPMQGKPLGEANESMADI